MREIDEQEIKKVKYYSRLMTVSFLITIATSVPLFFCIGFYAFIPFGIMYMIAMYFAWQVEKVKEDNDIQTYKEIAAFSRGEELTEIDRQREIRKRPGQKVILVILTAAVTASICLLIGLAIGLAMAL